MITDRNKHKKKSAAYFFIYLLILAVYAVAYFVIPFEKPASTWIAAGFTVLSILVSFFVSFGMMKKATTARRAFYSYPVIRFGVTYMVVQIIASVVFCVVGAFVEVPVWITLMVCVIWLAASLGGLIAAHATKKAIADIETDTEVKIRNTTEFRIDIVSVQEACKSDELRKPLEKLAEEFKYSDPVSSPDTLEIEKKIADAIVSLNKSVEANKVEDAKEKIRVLGNMLSERNRICKAFKKSTY